MMNIPAFAGCAFIVDVPLTLPAGTATVKKNSSFLCRSRRIGRTFIYPAQRGPVG